MKTRRINRVYDALQATNVGLQQVAKQPHARPGHGCMDHCWLLWLGWLCGALNWAMDGRWREENMSSLSEHSGKCQLVLTLAWGGREPTAAPCPVASYKPPLRVQHFQRQLGQLGNTAATTRSWKTSLFPGILSVSVEVMFLRIPAAALQWLKDPQALEKLSSNRLLSFSCFTIRCCEN